MWRIFVLLCCALAMACRDRGGPPDVILVTLDTTRADHLGVYGYERNTTPFLDGFARDSVVYTRAWASGAWTLPTHASIVTGKQITSHGARFDTKTPNVALSDIFEGAFFEKHKASRLAEDETTLAELLVERGYATAAFAGGPWLAPPFGLMQGYQLADADIVSHKGRSAEELTDHMIDWLNSVPAGQPLHALINFFDPHSPYDPPAGFDDLPGVRIPLDESQADIFVNAGRKLSKSQHRAVVDRYDGEIRYMDHHFGRLLDALKRSGRYENALIIAVGDHGELFGEHGVMGHGRWLYEEVVRVPLVIHYPGLRDAGTVVESPVSQVDLLPLVAKEVGIELTGKIDGLAIGSREGVLSEAFRDPFSLETYKERYDRDLVSLVRWPWKLIASDRGEREVYNLALDRTESRNSSEPHRLKSLESALAEAVGALERRGGSTPPSDVSPETIENLRRLGYID